MQTSISCFGYFGPRAAGLLPSSFRRSVPHQLSNQHRLVHGTLANHHPAIIAKSLHNVGPWELAFLLSAFLSCELSVANKHIIVIMLRPGTQLMRLRTIKWRHLLLGITSIIPSLQAHCIHWLTLFKVIRWDLISPDSNPTTLIINYIFLCCLSLRDPEVLVGWFVIDKSSSTSALHPNTSKSFLSFLQKQLSDSSLICICSRGQASF